MDASSSSLSSAISIGTAKLRPLPPLKPVATKVAGHNEPIPSSELLDRLALPSPRRMANTEPASPVSQDTMDHLRRRSGFTEKRRSIIDPSSVKLSFVGSITDLSQQLAMPLEEGFQKLYKLYEQNAPTPEQLPHEVQITEVPLNTIADSLEEHIHEQNQALHNCAENIQSLNLTNDRTKKELINVEFQFCLARQEANMRAMSSDDTRLRLDWMREEIARINTEKEMALQLNTDRKKENDRLRKELVSMLEVREENQKLKQINHIQEKRHEDMQRELDGAKRKLDRAEFALKTVPSPVQRTFAKLLVPKKEKAKENTLPRVESPHLTPKFY